jgi:hypothetical protein
VLTTIATEGSIVVIAHMSTFTRTLVQQEALDIFKVLKQRMTPRQRQIVNRLSSPPMFLKAMFAYPAFMHTIDQSGLLCF